MQGYFEDIEVYCGMGFDREEDVSPLCLVDSDKSLFVWSEKTLGELRRKELSPILSLWQQEHSTQPRSGIRSVTRNLLLFFS